MDFLPQALVDRARTPTGQKLIKYTAVSAISVVIAEIMLAFAYFIVRWSGTISNIFAVGVSSIPSYYLNRAWAWGKRGRSHLVKEVLPYLAASVLGLVAAMWSVDVASSHVKTLTGGKSLQVTLVAMAYVGTYAALWVLKFLFFNVLFARPHRAAGADAPAPQAP